MFTGICVALLLLLPNQSAIRDASSKEHPNQIQISPFKDDKDELQELDIEKKPLIDEFAAAADAQVIDNILEEPKQGQNEDIVKSSEVNDVDRTRDFKGPQNDRQRAVVAAFKHAWKGYKEFAWGHDNLRPLSMGSSDWFGLGLTIVDSLDTIYIMDLQEGKFGTATRAVRYLIIFNFYLF